MLMLLAALACLSTLNPQLSASPLGTAFTYQGRLNDGAAPANGTCDLTFAVYDDPTGSGLVAGPITNLMVELANGLFTAPIDFGQNVFNGDARWLEIGVRRNGLAGGFTILSPRQPLTPTPYALAAGNVSGPINGSLIAAGTITSTQLATGTVTAVTIASNSATADQLAPGAVARNLNALGQSPVTSGGIILSSNCNDANLSGNGYVRLGHVDLGDVWEQGASCAPLADRTGHTALWTGSEMIIWGGIGSAYFGDGARYNPAANSWTLMSSNSAPSPRTDHTAIWTGGEMIIWGGFSWISNNELYFQNGGRYNPASDTWTAINTNGAPHARAYHTAIWTGSEMIVWGGYYHTLSQPHYFSDGGRYSPAADSWTPMTTIAPAARRYHTVVWTGSEMIIWGGHDGLSCLGDGGRYDPLTDNWTPLSSSGAPAARQFHTAVWTGTEMIIWGGANDSRSFNDGARYSPAGNSWTAVSSSGAPGLRNSHSAVWTGTHMVVWGGVSVSDYLNDGGRYNPAEDSWTDLGSSGAPHARRDHTAVWTGNEMIVWGGRYLDSAWHNFNDGSRYDPAANSWSAIAPASRYSHTAVWTGSEMIVWGGCYDSGGDQYLNSGGRYNPAGNSWTALAGSGAPAPRTAHTAVWTGSEMIVWGGSYYSNSTDHYLNDGGRYNPASDSWTAVSTNGPPAARKYHTAVWTGGEMIVWGGFNGIYLNNGGRYNPAEDSWTPLSTVGAPAGRAYHTAVWTGTEIIVWGGNAGGASYLKDGGRYSPAGNTWTAVSTNGAPAARWKHTAVWTGTEMIIWGGNAAAGLNDGGRYNPAGNSWAVVSGTNAPTGRYLHTAVWTGSEMIVWGGYSPAGWLADGGRYDPALDMWTAVSNVGAPSPRQNHSAVWTGSRMIIWGGYGGSNLGDTFCYTPSRVLYLYQRQ